MYEDLPAHRQVDKRFEDNFPYWRGKYDAMERLRSFLAGDRYVNNTAAFNKDRRGVQIRGQDIQDTIRHVVAKATEKPRSVEGRPRDKDSDPDLSEVMVGLVTDELSDPYKGFERERYAAIQSCREQRLGIVWMDVVADHSPFGLEMFYGWQAPDRVMWDNAYHPHHPLCGWLIRDRRIDVDAARAAYKAPWLEPDKELLTSSSSNWKGIPLLQGYTDRLAGYCQNDNKVTIRECWYKNDRTVSKKSRLKDSEKLKPGDRYMSCVGGCGERSDSQSTLKKLGAIRGELPAELESGCPTCGGNMMRIDAVDVNQSVLAYSRGRRLVLTAPFSPNPEDVPVYDSSWPIPKARSFPALFLFASVKPGDVMGPCDVDWMWDQQVAQDNLDTLAVQRVFEHRNYWLMPEQGINNAQRKRFEFRNDDNNQMFMDLSKLAQYGFQKPELYNGTGLDPAWGAVRGMVNQNLTRYRPVADIGMTEGRAADVPVGTTEARVEQSETSTADFIRRTNQELSMFYGVVADYIAATYTPERLARVNIDGADILLNLEGDDLPNYDFVVSETPDFTGIEKERSQAWDSALSTAMQIAQTMGPQAVAPAIEAWGQFHSVPKTVIRSIQKMFAEQQAATEAEAVIPPAPGGQGPPNMEAPGAGVDQSGPSGNGAVPLPVA